MDLCDHGLNLESFLKDQAMRLERDKKKESSKLNYRHPPKSHEESFHNHNSVKHINTSSQPSDPVGKQHQDKKVVKEKNGGYVLLSSREKEKEKLINILSEPKKRHSCSSINELNKSHSSKLDRNHFATDLREREKDRLAAIFASSSYRFSIPSNYQISKNLNSGICLESNERCHLNSTRSRHTYTNDETNFTQDQKRDNYNSQSLLASKEKSSNQKNNIPEILVSEHLEDVSHVKSKANTETKGNTMVRIGEFSPLNPNHPVGKPMLGVGEYEERRQLFLDQRKQEYNEYLQQAHQVPRIQSPTRDDSDHNLNHHLRNAATQTEWEEEAGFSQRLEKRTLSPNASCQAEESHCVSPHHRTSPIPKCFDGLSEKEIKEYLYREELRKQIEEKNRLKEEMKRRDAEEEAKLEAKIRRDQEEMRRQFEAERIHRLELAIRKKEQEDIIRQRLATEQLRALQESKAKKKQIVAKSTSPRDNFSPRSRAEYGMQTLSQSLPANCAYKALSDVHDVLRQPLLEVEDYHDSTKQSPPEKDVPSKNVSALEQPLNVKKRPLRTLSPPIHKVKEVDVIAQKSVLNPGPPKTFSRETQSEPLSYSPHNPSEKIREVHELLRQPLFLDSHQVLPPMSPPLLHATIPPPSLYHPANSARSASVPASKNDERTNPEVLEERWKVPYVERYNVAPPDVFTKHNRSVLTQLGAFRRHLQQERLKMEKRVIDDTP